MGKSFKVLEVFKQSFKIVSEEPSIIGIFLLALLGMIVVSIPFLFLGASILLIKDLQTLLVFSPLILLTIILFAVIGLWVVSIGAGGVLLKVEAKLKRKKMKFWEALRKGFRNSGRLLLASIAEQGIVALGYLFLIIPGIYLAIRLALVVPACVLEKRGLGIKESWGATKGNFWRIFLLILLWTILFIITSFIPYLMITWVLLLPAYLISLALVYVKLRR